MIDQEVIQHLFEVERQASELLSDAQEEYNKQLDSFKLQAESLLKEEKSKIIQIEEKRYADAIESCKADYKKSFDEYCNDIKKWNQDVDSLKILLDELLFKK